MNTEEEILIDERIESLLTEFDDHRIALKSMVADLEKLKGRIDTLIPETMDSRYIRLFEEKVKALTNFFTTILEMRKEIAKSVKDEIEIRRRLKKSDDDLDLESMMDIRSFASKIQDFKEEKDKLVSKRTKELEEQNLEGIEIPGITTILEEK
jgi:hypothetical protein